MKLPLIMHPTRITFAARCALASAVAAASPSFCAERPTYPSKPIRIVAPSAPGSSADLLARTLAKPLSDRLGQTVVVDTRPGAGSIYGTELVAKSPADGYTLLIATPALAINHSIPRSTTYDGLNDFVAITLGVKQPNVLAVHPSVPAKSVRDLVALARARPGELTYASGGVGSISHLTVELFLLMSKTRMLHVPYKGGPGGFVDLTAGRIALIGTSAISTLPHLRAGRVRALAVTTAERTSVLADVPTVAESGLPGYEAVGWFGVVAPAGTPKEIVSLLSKEIVTALNQPGIRDIFRNEGADVIADTPEHFTQFIRLEAGKWAKVNKAAGIGIE